MPAKPPPGHFSILYFASAASYTNKTSEDLKAPLPLVELFDELERKYPGMKEKVLSSCAVTVNLDYVDVEVEASNGISKGMQSSTTMIIREGDEVAIIPPVSSG